MKRFYSPFTNNDGVQISLTDISFDHIVQLKDRSIEEGYQVEYKSCWNDNLLKKHLCQTISAFANSEGGWLFIGIGDDGKYVGIKKQITDFSQIIAQKLTLVSPTPRFDSKFIEYPSDTQNGVLIIYVHEGMNPPYVFNGTIYLRSGSSKLPIRSDRIEIDHLIQKRDKLDEGYNNFCTNDLFDETKVKYPYCSIYLYDSYADHDINNLADTLRSMKAALESTGRWGYISYSSDSVLCYSTNEISSASVTPITEFFANGNVKIFCPLFLLQNEHCRAWSRFVMNHTKNIDVSGMAVIDGTISVYTLFASLGNAFEQLLCRGYHINDYDISFRYKNIWKTVLFFRHILDDAGCRENYIKEIQNDGIHFSQKHQVNIPPSHFLENVDSDDPGVLSMQLVNANFAFLFGIDPRELEQQIAASMPLYGERQFASKFSYQST